MSSTFIQPFWVLLRLFGTDEEPCYAKRLPFQCLSFYPHQHASTTGALANLEGNLASESNLCTPSLCIRWNEIYVVLFAGTCTCASSINVIIWWRRRYPYSHDDGWWYLISILFILLTVNNLLHNFCWWKFKIFNYLSTNKRWRAKRRSFFASYWYTLWPKSLSHFGLICLWNPSMHSKWRWH